MTLQQKTILSVGCLFGAFALMMVIISQSLLSKSYSELERDQARLQVRYIKESFNQFGQEMATFSRSISTSRATAGFIVNPGGSADFPKYVAPRQLYQSNINFLLLSDVDGNIRLKSYYDPSLGDDKSLTDASFEGVLKAVRKNFVSGTPSSIKGLVQLELPGAKNITLYVEAEPVAGLDRRDLAAGILILGRRLDDEDIKKIHTLDGSQIDYVYSNEKDLGVEWKEAINIFNKGEESHIKIKNANVLATYTTVRDLDNRPLLNIKVESPRTFYQRGQDTLRLFVVWTVIVGVATIAVSYWVFERNLIWRIRLIGSQLGTIRRKKNPTLRLTMTGKDELGTLTEDINQTLASLNEEQTQREQAQREHKIIIDSLKEVIFRIDKQGKWTYLNPAWKELTGYSERETLEQYWGKSIYVDDLPQAQELLDTLLEGKTEFGNIEVRYHTKSGAVRWVQVFARETRDGRNEVTGITGTLFDITERINAEQKLRESEKLYRLVSENSTDVIFRLTLQGDILYTSRASTSILGYTPEEMRNTWIYDYCHPDDSLRVQKAYQKILEKGVVSTVEHQIRQKNGQYLWVESVGKPITDEEGKPVVDDSGRLMELIITTRDITERKNNEKELLLREKALSSASCGIIIADAVKTNKPIIYANKGFERMTGYGAEEWTGKHAFFIGGALTETRAIENLERGLNEASEVDETLLCYRKDGSSFWNQYALTPLYDKGGRLTHFIGVLTDVSGIKSIQGELEKAKDVAEGANRAKSEFLATMSHEIRTPMNAVIGFAELMSNTPLNEEQKEFLSTINSSANALLVLINDVLDFSKVEAGKLELDPQPCVLAQVIEEATMQVKLRADAKGLKLAYKMDPAVPSIVIMDGVRVRQILLNLLSNAAKFTQKGGVTITVRHQMHSDTSAQLYFEVIDTGIGIPEDKLGRLFQSFSQVDSSTTRKYGGTGLGLAICKKFCELMEGSIGVTSTYGKGSTFKFDIKVAIDQELLQAPVATTVTATTVSAIVTANPMGLGLNANVKAGLKSTMAKINTHTDTQPYRILVVEDNPANQLMLLKMLAQMNLAADMANQGKEALEKWVKEPYQVILTDLQMPEMDGLELTRALRDKEKMINGAPTYIIGVTANVLPEYRETCISAGMDDFLTKPLKMESLKRALQKYQPSKV